MVLDQRQAAARLGDQQAARMTNDPCLRGDEQQVHWRRERGVARRPNHRRIAQEGGVEGRKDIACGWLVATQMLLDDCSLSCQGRGQVGHQHAACVGGRAGQLGHMNTVDEHQSRGRFCKLKAGHVGSRHAARTAGRLQRQLAQRCQVGEAPGLIARCGHGQRSEVSVALASQRINASPSAVRQARMVGPQGALAAHHGRPAQGDDRAHGATATACARSCAARSVRRSAPIPS